MHLLAHCPMGLLERVLAFVAAHKRRPPRSTALGLALYKERRLKKPFADATPAQRARLQKALDGAPTMAKKSISKSHQVGQEQEPLKEPLKNKTNRQNKNQRTGKTKRRTENGNPQQKKESKPGPPRGRDRGHADEREAQTLREKPTGPGPVERAAHRRGATAASPCGSRDVRCQPAVGQGQHRPGRAGHR